VLRRWALIALVAALAACGQAEGLTAAIAAPDGPAAAGPGSATTDPGPAPAGLASSAVAVPPSSAPPATTAVTLPPRPAPYEPHPLDADGEAKRLGARIASALTTYDPAETPDAVAAAIAADSAQQAALVAAAAPLWNPGRWSRGTVRYPQFGGLTGDAASLMVVVEQDIGSGATLERREVRTLDVRLVRVGDRWTFDQLASAGGERVERPASLSPLARAVVDDPRIELPDSARWDIYRGDIEPALLVMMRAIAEQTPFAVTVLESGHPVNVFATSRRSAHNRGAAVDIYRVGTELVVDSPGGGSPTATLASWVYGRDDLAQLGAPWDLAEGDRAFSDAVHRDHLHVAV